MRGLIVDVVNPEGDGTVGPLAHLCIGWVANHEIAHRHST